MPRIKKTDRPKRFYVYVPESILAKVEFELYSDIEGKVPFGKLSELTTELLSAWLRDRGVSA